MATFNLSWCNETYALINDSDPLAFDTKTQGQQLYNGECLDLVGCVPEAECTRYIESYVKPEFSEWIIICVYLVMFVVGLIGNGLVIAVVLRTSHMRTVINMFIVNLATADFMVLLICMAPSVIADVTESWYLGDVMCKVVPFFQTVSVAVSVLTLGAIAIERYFAICHPLKARFTVVTVVAFIAAIWMASILVALPELLYQGLQYTLPEHVTPHLQYCKLGLEPNQLKSYQIFLMIGLYDLPMCLMFFAHTTISKRLWKDTFAVPTNSDEGGHAGYNSAANRPVNQLQARRKAAKMLMTIVVMFAVCYLPIHVFNILRYNGTLYSMDEFVVVTYALIARGLCYLNSSINPIIYNFMSAKFRQEFKSAFAKCYKPFGESAKTPMEVYNFRVARANGHTRSERYSMNTYSTRPCQSTVMKGKPF